MNIKINNNTENIIYNGLDLGITITELSDYRLITGLEIDCVLEFLYNQELEKIQSTREWKIDQIIKPLD